MTIHRQKNIISTINKTFPFWGYGFNVFDWRSAVFINSEQAKRLSKIIKLRYNLVITVNRLLIFSLLLPINIFAQQPQPPKPPTFEPIKTGHYYTTVPNHQDNTYQKPQKTVPLGATAQDIINKTHGQGPIYTPNMTPQQRQQANMRYIQQQMANDPAYQLPNKSNTFSQNFNRSQQQKVAEILNEIHPTTNNNRNNAGYYKSPQFKQLTKPYTEALQQLKQQLTNNNISVRNAYYTIENAYGNPYLNKNEFNDLIKQSVEFIKIWLTQNGYSLKDNEALHYGIQKFIGEKLTITIDNPDMVSTPKKTTHLPFFYDYEDFKGEKDFRNYFLTKSLATGSGQCNSLPALYLSLAEGLGAKTYLSFAPQHSFIKYPDNQGNIHSYEPTSNWKISDKWYQDNMFISPKAKANGIYLDTLNSQQVVANSMLDLAFGYMTKYGAADETFIKDCINSSMQYFPKKNNIYAYFVYSSLLARQLEQTLYENNITDLKDVNKVPRAELLYNALLKNEETIKRLGYQDMPEELYQELMQQHEFKGKKQQEQQISGKQKRNLFITTF